MIGRYPLPTQDEGRSDTLWEGVKDNHECLVWVYFLFCRLYCMLKAHCLLHDVPPQTFIRPPMMAVNSSVFADMYVQLLPYEQNMNARTHSIRYPWFIFQVVLGQRKQSSWQVFLMHCRQTWCTPSQIQHLPEGMTFGNGCIHLGIINEQKSIKLFCLIEGRYLMNWFPLI